MEIFLVPIATGRAGCAACTMCVAAVLANAIGIPACVLTPAGREAKSPKCVGRSEAGLEVDSPGRRHYQKKDAF